MISAKELRNVDTSKYSNEELTYIIQQASDTIEGYEKESKEIYEKMEFLASKIEEYREEEDSIKAALITAEKSAEHTRKESQQKAQTLIEESEATAKKAVDDAQMESNKIIEEARNYATKLVSEKTQEADAIIIEAEKKSNEAINSAKVVAQNILDQAKEISTDLLAKSKEEKLAYSLLVKNIKNDAKDFVANLQTLYNEQLEALEGANFETAENEDENVDDIQSDVDSLVSEIDELKESFPRSIYLEDLEDQAKEREQEAQEEQKVEEEPVVEKADEVREELACEDAEEIANDEAEQNEQDSIQEVIEMKNPLFHKTELKFEEPSIEISQVDDEKSEEEKSKDEKDDEYADPMAALHAFSSNEYTPIEKTNNYISEIDEEPEMEDVYSNPLDNEDKSLFDDDQSMSFEDFFNVSQEKNNDDRTQTISLIPPEEEEEKQEPKFKGFFGRKKNK